MQLFIFFIFCILSTFAHEKVKLTDVEVLTLNHGLLTNGRRSRPVPQLECFGGSAKCEDKFLPRVVQCINMGSDGYDIQWKCQADLGTKLKFGKIDVNCEGYDYPNDKYILKGSCGLRYTLDISGSTGKSYIYQSGENSSTNGIYFLIFCVIVCALIYCFCLSNNTTDFQQASMLSAPNIGYPGEAPPPPGFRPDYTAPPEYESIYRSKGPRVRNSDGPGFWTGLGAGGLLGYMFGSRTTQQSPFYQRTSGYSGSHNNWRDYHSSSTIRDDTYSGESHEFRTAYGYGGTSRR